MAAHEKLGPQFQLEEIPGTEAGPQSFAEVDTYDAKVKRRMEASDVDTAFHREHQQRLIKQLGETSWGREKDLDITSVRRGGAERQPLKMTERSGGGEVTHLFRGMSEEEFQQAKTRGHVRSDQRGTFESWEGTNATPSAATARYYTPKRTSGRIIKMSVLNEDQWFSSPHTNYAHSEQEIPWDRVVAHTEEIPAYDEDQPGTVRQGVLNQEKIENIATTMVGGKGSH